MAHLIKFLYALCVLTILLPSVINDIIHERHVIHVPVFVHYVHHHHNHVVQKNKSKPRKKLKKVRSKAKGMQSKLITELNQHNA